MTRVVAVDLGASSGRVLRVTLDDHGLRQEEMHRFPNDAVVAGGTMYWDVLALWNAIQAGVERAKDGAQSIGLDAWGVDFALLDRQGRLIGNPVHYRDPRHEGMMEWVFERVPRRTVYERTGLQFMRLNTLYQLASMIAARSPQLEIAETYVSVPDLFLIWMGGRKVAEFTHATTTQLFNPRLGDWDRETLQAIGAPLHIFPEIVPPGTQTGEYQGLRIILPATHDTGSAVAGIPTTGGDDFAYISSGTWSLVGLELPHAVINDAAYDANVTNEGGVYGTYRFLNNVAGMWLVQQSRDTWREQGVEYSYESLAQMAEATPPFRSLFDPDDERFLAPGDVPARIREYCRETGQAEPVDHGAVIRAIYESLALKYRFVLERLARTSGRSFSRVHVIGGGSRNSLLCQMTADALGRPVIAGPSEATALGNAMVQLVTLGALASLAEARTVLSRSVETSVYEPRPNSAWDDAFGRFEALLKRV